MIKQILRSTLLFSFAIILPSYAGSCGTIVPGPIGAQGPAGATGPNGATGETGAPGDRNSYFINAYSEMPFQAVNGVNPLTFDNVEWYGTITLDANNNYEFIFEDTGYYLVGWNVSIVSSDVDARVSLVAFLNSTESSTPTYASIHYSIIPQANDNGTPSQVAGELAGQALLFFNAGEKISLNTLFYNIAADTVSINQRSIYFVQIPYYQVP